jgi:hypothetical protein
VSIVLTILRARWNDALAAGDRANAQATEREYVEATIYESREQRAAPTTTTVRSRRRRFHLARIVVGRADAARIAQLMQEVHR